LFRIAGQVADAVVRLPVRAAMPLLMGMAGSLVTEGANRGPAEVTAVGARQPTPFAEKSGGEAVCAEALKAAA
jgi:hypothetical protein